MADVLSRIPGLAGYLGMQQMQRQQAMQDLQGSIGLMGALRQQQQAEQEAQMAPLRMQALQARLEAEQQERAFQNQLPSLLKQATGPDGAVDYGKFSSILMGTPGGLQTGMNLRRAEEDRAMRIESSMAAIDQRRQQAEMLHQSRMAQAQTAADRAAEQSRHNEFMRAIQAQAMELRQQNAAAKASQGGGAQVRAPMGYRFKENGDLEPIPGGPADAKATADAERRAQGSTDVDITIGALRDAYDRLEKGGGITSKEKGALPNLGASASASPIGQMVGRALGTANQSARNEVTMLRPALLAALMKATGMSARQMDSNAELKLWLNTATDPTLDVEANRKALKNIEERFLRKPASAPSSPESSQPAAPSAGKFEVGKTYVDGSGRRAKYLGDGKWQNQ